MNSNTEGTRLAMKNRYRGRSSVHSNRGEGCFRLHLLTPPRSLQLDSYAESIIPATVDRLLGLLGRFVGGVMIHTGRSVYGRIRDLESDTRSNENGTIFSQ